MLGAGQRENPLMGKSLFFEEQFTLKDVKLIGFQSIGPTKDSVLGLSRSRESWNPRTLDAFA
jgi:hypothetical protein